MNIKSFISEEIKTWHIVLAVIGSIAFIVTTAFSIDKHFAKEKEQEMIVLNFEEYKIEEAIDRTQSRIWDTEDRLKKEIRKDPELVNKLRELRQMKDKLDKKLNNIYLEQKER
jgi:hypothetical protein